MALWARRSSAEDRPFATNGMMCRSWRNTSCVLLLPEGKERLLIFNVEDVPAVAERLLYFKEPMFNGLYDE